MASSTDYRPNKAQLEEVLGLPKKRVDEVTKELREIVECHMDWFATMGHQTQATLAKIDAAVSHRSMLRFSMAIHRYWPAYR